MTKPTQMEKLEEIVRALEEIVAKGRIDDGEHCHWEGCDSPRIAKRVLTLARELRDNAVEVHTYLKIGAFSESVCVEADDGTEVPEGDALLILSDPTP